MRAFLRDFFYILMKKWKWMVLMLLAAFTMQWLIQQEGMMQAELKPLQSWLLLLLRDPGLHINYRQFFFPLAWFAFHLAPTLLIADAIWKDHQSNGTLLMMQAGSRRTYFLAALSSGIVHLLLIQILLTLSVMLAAVAAGGSGWRMDLSHFLRIQSFFALENGVLLLLFLVVALYFGYRAGLIVLLVWLGVVAFLPVQWLLGSGSLVFRQNFADPEGYEWMSNLMITAGYFIPLLGLYFWRSSRYDFLSEVYSS